MLRINRGWHRRRPTRDEQACEALEKVNTTRGLSTRIKVDNGPDFIS